MAPPGKSANTVTSPALAGVLPMARPPSLRKSFGFERATLPAPITTRRATLRPSGTTRSRAAPLLPVKPSALAARATRPAAEPSALAVAEPSLTPSSQNTMRTPLAGAAKGPNPSLRASDMGVNLFPGDQTGWVAPIWRAQAALKSPKLLDLRAFHLKRPGLPARRSSEAGIGLPESWLGGLGLGPKARPRLNFLLCMFNGFAFARPLCGPIKVNLMGDGF